MGINASSTSGPNNVAHRATFSYFPPFPSAEIGVGGVGTRLLASDATSPLNTPVGWGAAAP